MKLVTPSHNIAKINLEST